MSLGFQVTVDCANPAKLAEFWAKVLNYEIMGPPPGFATWEDWLRSANVPEDKWDSGSFIHDPEGKHAKMFFQKVPEGKVAKNRMHLDVHLDVPQGAPPEERKKAVGEKVKELQELGATKHSEHSEFGSYWVVMSDPEGNEFCLG